MTGSRRWFGYEGDNVLQFAVELDESVYETAALGMAPIQSGATGPLAQGRVISVSGTRPLSMRYINATRVNARNVTERRRFYVGTIAAFAALRAAGVVVVDGTSWSITSSRGEQAVGVPATDTAIDDGDTDDNFVAGP